MTEPLHIGRLSCIYQVPRDHPAPESLRLRLDEVAREGVGSECGRVIGAMLDPNDPSVWVVDRLDVSLTVDIGMIEKAGVASLWASRIAGSLARTFANGPDLDAGVRRFANRAEYLAWLLGDLLAGRPWSSLHTREFEGLRALPLSGLIAEALAREPERAERVLQALVRAGYLPRLIRALTLASALRLLSICADRDDSLVDRELWRLVQRFGNDTQNPLEIYLLCCLESPHAPPAAIRAAAERSAQLRDALDSAAVRDALGSGNFSLALKLCRTAEHRRALLLLYTLAAGDSQWLNGTIQAAAPERNAGPSNSFDTPFGGVFLLLPDLIALYPEAQPLLRYVVLLKCLGRDVAPVAWSDPALLLASGVEKPPAFDEIRDCRADLLHPETPNQDLAHFSLDRLLPEPESDHSCARAALLLMRQFARRFLGLERSSPQYLFRNIVSGPTTILTTPGRIAVRLEPRPLQIVIRMAGLNGFKFSPPWMPHTEIVFELPDD